MLQGPHCCSWLHFVHVLPSFQKPPCSRIVSTIIQCYYTEAGFQGPYECFLHEREVCFGPRVHVSICTVGISHIVLQVDVHMHLMKQRCMKWPRLHEMVLIGGTCNATMGGQLESMPMYLSGSCQLCNEALSIMCQSCRLCYCQKSGEARSVCSGFIYKVDA